MARKTAAANDNTLDIATYLNQRFNDAQTSAKKVQDARESLLRYSRQDMAHIPSNEGESKISTAEVRDTVQTLLPQILEPFLTGEGAGTFEPTSEEDAEQAKLETAYTRYVMFSQNQGFDIFTQWVLDGLLQKNGYIKAWWKREVTIEPEEYEGVGFDEAERILTDESNGRIVQQSITLKHPQLGEIKVEQDAQLLAILSQTPPEAVLAMTVDLVLVRELVDERAALAPVAPENLVVEPGYIGVVFGADCSYVAERMYQARWKLKQAGYPAELVNQLSKASAQLQNEEASNRTSDQTNTLYQIQNLKGDDEIVEVREHYIRSDLDGSGITKLWKVCTGGGDSHVILSREMVSRIPYHSWTPVRQSHQHYGTAAAELVNDLQDINTVMWRQSLNAVVANNRLRPLLDETKAGLDTYSDLMSTVPGHPIRMRDITGLAWTSPPNTALQTLPMMEKLEAMVEGRTGLSKMAQGLDATALADSTNMMGAMVMSQSLLRVKMMLRTFAETGVRSLMEHVREMIMKHEKRERIFEYMGEYVQINPTDWRNKRNTVIKVGLGYNGKLEKVAALQGAFETAKQVVEYQGGADGPLVTIENAYNLVSDLFAEQGLITKGRYISEPPSPEEAAASAGPPEPTPMDIAEAELVSKNEIEASKLQVELVKIFLEDERERAKLNIQATKSFADIVNMVKGQNDNEQAGKGRASQPAA